MVAAAVAAAAAAAAAEEAAEAAVAEAEAEEEAEEAEEEAEEEEAQPEAPGCQEPELAPKWLQPWQELEAEAEPELVEQVRRPEEQHQAEPEAPAGPMDEFGAAEVLRWLETVDGLSDRQRAAIKDRLEDEEYIGKDLLDLTERSLPRLLRGTDASGAAPVLLVARDKHLADAAPAPPPPPPQPEKPPAEYLCSISRELMVDPVCTASGQTYERECIALWLRTKQTDPISNARLPNKRLLPNFALRGAIVQWREAHPKWSEC